ncbi:MAG: hypothetical protein KatS3mg128_1056 [Silanimonas sp.]|nr:MAG: hypothetical protein KatS3mg128_0228 [Silanimonas sp.]GIX40007.1 MAG: hypothetical protein KatS3mg128_1056 [Silanimonas sp.]
MSEKKAYPLRISAPVLDAVQRWADDELRSVNAQIEYVLREALRKAGRLPKPAGSPPAEAGNEVDTGA